MFSVSQSMSERRKGRASGSSFSFQVYNQAKTLHHPQGGTVRISTEARTAPEENSSIQKLEVGKAFFLFMKDSPSIESRNK